MLLHDMNAQSDKPLVTISMITYNQEKFVRDAVKGLLSQDYSPLEIVISDDCSTDNTWQIIQEEVTKYKANGGEHKIILNHNAHNMGIVKHCEFVGQFRHGALVVGCGGDDISLPNRVSTIVKAWEESGREATIIHHGYEEIDIAGNSLGIKPPRSAQVALGATAAYDARVFEAFPPLGGNVSIEDQAWAKRALMLGPELRIDDVLVKYRVGCGVSTKFKSERERLYLDAITMVQSCGQVLKDLEEKKDVIDKERYDLVYEMAFRLYNTKMIDAAIVSRQSIFKRIDALCAKIRSGGLGYNPVRIYVYGVTYLQPWTLGNFQRQMYLALRRFLRNFLEGVGKRRAQNSYVS